MPRPRPLCARLQQTNKALETTQNRISTGLKIGEAKDNAAYWAISTTLKSDNKSLATVKDALSLGAATVDVAYQGLNKTKEVLDEIKSKLTAATQDGVDKARSRPKSTSSRSSSSRIASASTFSGENWLSVNSEYPVFRRRSRSLRSSRVTPTMRSQLALSLLTQAAYRSSTRARLQALRVFSTRSAA